MNKNNTTRSRATTNIEESRIYEIHLGAIV